MPGATRSDLPDDAKGRGVIGAMGCVGRSANKDRCSCKIKDLSSMFQQRVAGQGPSTKSQAKAKGQGPRAKGQGPRAKGQGPRAKGQGPRAKGQGPRAVSVNTGRKCPIFISTTLFPIHLPICSTDYLSHVFLW